MTINPRDATPIYTQIVNQIKLQVASGEKTAGAQLPSVRELALALTVNPNTVLKAYAELERDGVVTTRRGQGNFVADTAKRSSRDERLAMFAGRCQPAVAEGAQLGLSIDQMVHVVREEHTKLGQVQEKEEES